MSGMILNYLLLAVTGVFTLISIITTIKGGRGDNKIFRPFFTGVLFVLVLIATIKGINYYDFKLAIETGNWNFK